MKRLDVRNLSTSFETAEGSVHAVADVSFAVESGRTTALVGESGSGKSVTSLTLMRLLPRTAATVVTGQALFVDRTGETVDLLQLPEPRMRGIRGNQAAMIFQEPMTSLNPVLRIGEQIAESLRLHKDMGSAAALAQALRLLELVEIPAAAQRLREYPHQLSGGMRQRVMIALAMACDPAVLIADEPTTALDVTIQAQILEVLRDALREFHTSLVLITHNLSLVAELADRVAVMYAGYVVETATVGDLFHHPRHPYTVGLLRSVPSLERQREWLVQIAGQQPSPADRPSGCPFHPRCYLSLGREQCSASRPWLQPTDQPAHVSACHFWSEVGGAEVPV
jgi:peptide/nickel transport system ATP-binding protein